MMSGKLKFICLIFFIPAVIICFGINSSFALEEVHDTKKIIKYKIPPVYGKINEVIIAGGVQKYIFIRIKNAKNLVRKGWKGYIFNGSTNGRKIGKFKIISIVRNYVKGVIVELTDTVSGTAYVRIDRDPLIR